MKKIGIMLPYFGKKPSYFPLWLMSVKHNSTIDWLLLTDDSTPYDYPDNVKVISRTFDWTKKLIQSKFPFPIRLRHPWDLCAFKPSYGDVFSEYLTGYDFWGYCDCDMIFGDIRKFLTEDVFESFDKILWLGHLSLIRNNQKFNNLYKGKTRGGEILYKRAFEHGSVSCFDEVGLNDIFANNGGKIYQKVHFADFVHRSFLFRFVIEPEVVHDTIRRIFSWENGRLFCHELVDDVVYKTEFLYVHFCRRPMSLKSTVKVIQDNNAFLIVPGKLKTYQEPDQKLILQNTRSRIYWKYILPRLKPNRLLAQRLLNVLCERVGLVSPKKPILKYWLTNGRK